jgi:phage-related protein
MAGIPKVKISFDADFDQLKKGVTGAANEVEGFGSKVGDFSKKAGLAFAAAGAAAAVYAGKLLIDGVKSAIEDEAAQAKLALTLHNVAGATTDQVAAVEKYITSAGAAFGITDTELRPSLERLARATKDVDEAQKLQTLAIDIAAGSGKSLESVSNALGKAYEGNTGALAKLGVGLSAAELKTMSMDQVTAALAKTFEGQAAAKAETFAGKMDRLKVVFGEAKETVGTYVLDAVTPLVSKLVTDVIPAVQNFASSIGEKLGPQIAQLAKFFTETLVPALQAFWKFLFSDIIPAIISVVKPTIEGLFNAFNSVKKALDDNSASLQPFYDFLKKIWEFTKNYLAPLLGGAFKTTLEGIGSILVILIKGFSALVGFITGAYEAIKKFVTFIKDNPIVSGISNAIGTVFGGGKAMGGAVSGGTPYLVGERGAELFVPNGSGTIVPNNRLGGGNTVINLNVTGAIDPEGTARSIINVLNNSAFRGTGGASNLVTV